MKFRNLSVSSKVMAAFACVLVATVALGVFAMQRLSELNANAEETSDRWVPAMQALAEFQYNSTRFRSFSSTFLLPADEEQRKGTLKLLKSTEEKSRQALDRFKTITDTPEGRELADQLDAAWTAYEPMREKQVELYKSGGLPAAAAYFMGPMRKSFGKLTKATDAAIAYSAKGALTSAKNSRATFVSSRIWIYGAVGLALLLCAGAWFVINRAVIKPLSEMTGAVGRIAAGETDTGVPGRGRQDEIGRLAEAVAGFVDQIAAAERSKRAQTETIVSGVGVGLDRLAKGDLTHRITADLSGPFAKLKEDFNKAMEQLQDTMKHVRASTGQIASGSGEISQAADDLSRRTEQQAASLEQTSAALEEITTTVKRTASNASQVRQSMGQAKDAAELGEQVVDTAIRAMDSISHSSKQVADIIGVIDEIAFQTNLLALNAGVEAARAGDAGKGFAVVASEVRALAGRSSEAAKQIKALIKASGEHVGSGVKYVGETGAALRRIVEQVQEINALVSEMAHAAELEATGIAEVSSAIGQMDQVTQQNAAMVEQSTAASRNLAHETQALAQLVSFFNVGEWPQAAREAKAPPRAAIQPVKLVAAAGGGSAPRAQAAQADDWEEF